ncbi:alpha/beta hydrolase [Alkalicoccus halolimnae]|uniref:Alpha/beta hydrolase n=1 Tax=Alkalicoccus halolimnae TaxID=1667239 RepID=A0A5C7F993_9BACI|nr:alpha/beta hydrolase [Alkalicoccus halolimnae]TXF81965.1 alpha/beta hydrolase [Alkalicoccus halolimnae]
MWKWEAAGKPKATVVIVHGAGEYHARYEWVIEEMRHMNFHVFMGDLPGQGTTEGARGHVDSFKEYVHKVREWLNEAGEEKLPLILFGHSMGGLISVTTLQHLHAEELPDMVVLSSPCFGLVNVQPWIKRSSARVLNRVAPRTMFPNGLEPGTGTRDPFMRTRDAEDPLLVKRVSARWYNELTTHMYRAHKQIKRTPNIPFYVMQGGEDKIVDKYAVKAWFNALDVDEKAYKEWPGLYHEVLNEPEREQVLAHMAGFITTQLVLK